MSILLCVGLFTVLSSGRRSLLLVEDDDYDDVLISMTLTRINNQMQMMIFIRIRGQVSCSMERLFRILFREETIQDNSYFYVQFFIPFIINLLSLYVLISLRIHLLIPLKLVILGWKHRLSISKLETGLLLV